MAITHPAHGEVPLRETIPVHQVSWSDLRWALRAGWGDFMALRGDILFVGLLYPAVGLLVSMIALNQSLLPLAFPLAAGISLLGPVVAAGFYELARRRERGEDIRWRHFFDVFTGPKAGPVIGLGLAMLGLFVLWLAAAMAIYGLFFGDGYLGIRAPASVESFLSALFTTETGWGLIIVGNLAGLAFAIAALAMSVVSFPMIIDRRVDVGTAVETSVRAVARNPVTMAGWGLIVAVLLVIGSVPFFIGLAVVLPWLGYSTWHLYTRAVER